MEWGTQEGGINPKGRWSGGVGERTEAAATGRQADGCELGTWA